MVKTKIGRDIVRQIYIKRKLETERQKIIETKSKEERETRIDRQIDMRREQREKEKKKRKIKRQTEKDRD